ncbi:MAG: hypothetical protein WB952_05550 [Terriglobales bacterium]
MLRPGVTLCATAVLFFLHLGAAQSQLPLPASSAEAPADPCSARYALRPLDEDVLQLLGTPVMPSGQNPFTDTSFQQLREWDFPSKVTAWHDRPSPPEIARRRDQLLGRSSSDSPQNSKHSAPAAPGQIGSYNLQPFSPKDWKDLEKWFAKDGPKKLPGMCVDQERASYVLAVGIILDGSVGTSLTSASNRIQYNAEVIRQPDSSIGPNAATLTPGGTERPAGELSGISGSSGTGLHTCAYLFDKIAQSATQPEPPKYYYCRSGGDMPRATVTTMLKYLAKPGQ